MPSTPHQPTTRSRHTPTQVRQRPRAPQRPRATPESRPNSPSQPHHTPRTFQPCSTPELKYAAVPFLLPIPDPSRDARPQARRRPMPISAPPNARSGYHSSASSLPYLSLSILPYLASAKVPARSSTASRRRKVGRAVAPSSPELSQLVYSRILTPYRSRLPRHHTRR